MNLLKLISSEDPIGGLEIEDSAIRFSLLKKTQTAIETIILTEEILSEKENLANATVFADKLIKFAKKNKIKYVIVSIPSDNIFVKTYSFPVAMPDNKISESMGLTVDLQLPKKKEEIYCDWMKTEESDTDKKILLAYAAKTRVNNILSIIQKAGLKVVAIESRMMSLARIIKQGKNEALLAVEKGKDISIIAVIINNNVIFSQSFPNNKLADNLSQEIRKILNYYDWFNISIKNLILIGDKQEQKVKKLPLKILEVETVSKIEGLKKDLKWLIPLGAALRGIIPRKNDEIISFMDIGTETAYKREKTNSTVNFFIGLNTALSIFFFAAFMATWSLITVIQNNYTKQISSFNLLPTAGSANTLRDKAGDFNSLVDQAGILIEKEPLWSKVVEEIKNKTVGGITVNNISLPGADGVLSITGIATNREAINNLKQSFETSNLFGEISIPLDNLGKKVDIPFSMTFKIKNTELIYNK